MAVKGSGALSIATDIVGEFGGDAPHSLSEYYGGGTYVPAGANPGIATSGQINMGSHYGAVAATVLTISSNTNNYDIGAAAIAAGGDKSTPVILTINAGVTVSSTSSAAAMFTGTGWSSGTTINITNNGSLIGSVGADSTGSTGGGGAGGRGAGTCPNISVGSGGSGGAGAADTPNAGGSAFEHSQTADNNLAVIFDTAGTRTAGTGGTLTSLGGGGGGGGSNTCNTGGGSGGGGGGNYGGGGNRGRGFSWNFGNCGQYGNSGQSGGATTGGSGGAKSYQTSCQAGGNGGALGSSGAGRSSSSGGSGGSTYTATGAAGSVLSGNTGQIS